MKRVLAAFLSALMLVSIIPSNLIDVLAADIDQESEELISSESEAVPESVIPNDSSEAVNEVKEPPASAPAKAPVLGAAPADCTHTHYDKYTVKESLYEGKGKGDIIYCTDCGKCLYCDNWTDGDIYDCDTEVKVDLEAVPQVVVFKVNGVEKKLKLKDDEPVPHEHNYVVTAETDSTCFEEGSRTYTCSICQDSYTEIIPKKTHNFVYDRTVSATCKDYGYTVYKCTLCHTETRSDYTPKSSDHSWDEGTVTEEPSCKPGVMTYTCTLCQETKNEEIPAIVEHEYKSKIIKEPGCESSGIIAYTCTVCQESYTDIIPAEGHDKVRIGSQPATCTETGYDEYRCIKCNETFRETTPMIAHDWQVISDSATCIDPGIAELECSVCHTTEEEISQALGHDWGEWEVITEATCTEPGVKQRECSRGCIDSQETDPLGHNYVDFFCTRCGQTYPEAQEIFDKVAELPYPEEVTPFNARTTLNDIKDIQSLIDAINNHEGSEYYDILKDLIDRAQVQEFLAEVEAKCLKYISASQYEYTPGEQCFNVKWNDNNEPGRRVAAEDFLEASNASLSFRIRDEHNNVIATGSLTSAQDVRDAFGFLPGFEFDDSQPLLNIDDQSIKYIISNNESLPVRYTTTYTDYQTLEVTKERFTVDYFVDLDNPCEESYVVTKPDSQDGKHACLGEDEDMILSIIAEWTANIIWHDDNNRSAEGGTSQVSRPRVSEEDLKSVTKVYEYVKSYNEESGTEVTKDFTYEITRNPVIEDQFIITLGGLPAYDNDGNPITYYITQERIDAANADVVPGNHYEPKYLNNGNYSAKDNGLYADGLLFETLTNSVTFTVTKNWMDGRTPETRPNSDFYIWRITEDYNGDALDIEAEFQYAIPETSDSYAVPKEDTNLVQFERIKGEGHSLVFPMYDDEGRRYIYFGKESALPGAYSSTIDNSTANASAAVVNKYNADYPGYFLNGSVITNKLTDNTTTSVAKVFKASSIQNEILEGTEISTSFLLQKKNAETGVWESAQADTDLLSDADGVTIKVENNHVIATLNEFPAEDMSDSVGGVVLNRYDDVFNVIEYRWIETDISINGVSAQYDPALWQGEGTSLTYAGQVVVNEGQTRDNTSGPEKTTAIFASSADGNTFTNELIGDEQVEIKKYFYDENGNSIAADPVKMEGIEVIFEVYRDGEPFDTVTMTYADLVEGGDYWLSLNSYDRYHDGGKEYRFTVKEINNNGQWLDSANYETKIVEYPEGSNILLKRLCTEYVNGPMPGNTLWFEVEKEWLDDSDLVTRNPVQASVYRVKDINGQPLAQPEAVKTMVLNLGNNWYQKVGVAVEEGDSEENYVVIEDGMLVNGALVPSSISVDYASARSNMRGADYEVGTVGGINAVGGSWDGLEYRYRVFEQERSGEDTPALDSYLLTNLRIGTIDCKMTKTWVAGDTVRASIFALFLNGSKVGSFRLDIDPDSGKGTVSEVKWESGFDASGVTVGTTSEYSHNVADGKYKATIIVSGLPKFDDKGVQLDFSMGESAIVSDDGTYVPVEGGTCTVDGKTYAVSGNSTTDYAPSNEHRSPDLYTYSINNTIRGKMDLESFKVWRDDATLARPDISFSVYRMSTEDETLRALVEAGDSEGMASYLAGFADNSHAIRIDKHWDTKINDFMWKCSINDMEQYDPATGFPYVYFGTETIAGKVSSQSDVTYSGYYCNYTVDQNGYRPVNPAFDGFDTEDVFGVPNDNLSAKDGSVFILADGVHDVNGDYSKYYSATAVNRPEGSRYIWGKKLWKFPLSMYVNTQELPPVTVELYRSHNQIAYSDYSSTEEYINDVKSNAEYMPGTHIKVINSMSIDANSESGSFTYDFDKDSKGNILPRFDEFGRTYYYYILESGEIDKSFPNNEVTYNDSDFNISNVFASRSPYVEVSLTKAWYISEDLFERLAEEGLEGLDVYDLAPATFKLYGNPTNARGNRIAGAETLFNQVTIKPAVAGNYDSDGDGINDTVITVKTIGSTKVLNASYTFKTYYNDATGQTEKLPYYWLKNYPIKYAVRENSTSGYMVIAENNGDDPNDWGIKLQLAPGSDECYSNGSSPADFSNVYNGLNTERPFSVEFTKTWDKSPADNDDWRPDSVTFEIHRRVPGHPEYSDDYTENIILKKSDFEGQNVWNGELENLLQYSPGGFEYEYYVYSETCEINGVSKTVTIDDTDKQLGSYNVGFNNVTVNNSFTDGKKTSVYAEKTWSFADENGNGIAVTSFDAKDDTTSFMSLRKMGVIPDTLTLVVERRAKNSSDVWKTVPASSEFDGAHQINYNGSMVLGRSVDYSSAAANSYSALLNPIAEWNNLPKTDSLGRDFEYRVIEVLEWSDGTVKTYQTNGESANNVTASFTTSESTQPNKITCEISNSVELKKVKIAKVWEDENNYDNTRPDSIHVTIARTNGSGTDGTLEFDLAASGNSMQSDAPNRYVSKEFYTLKGTELSYLDADLSKNFVITESFTDKDGQVYTKDISSEGHVEKVGDTWLMKVVNTYEHERKTFELEAVKAKWDKDDKWVDIVRPAIKFQIEYLDNKTNEWISLDSSNIGMFSSSETTGAKTADASNNWTVNWQNMYKYWYSDKMTTDGKPELIRYRCIEVIDNSTEKSSYSVNYRNDENTSTRQYVIGETVKKSTIKATNTLQTTNLKNKKAWYSEGGTTAFTNSRINSLIELNAIPKTVYLTVEYSVDNGSTWNRVPTMNNDVPRDMATLASAGCDLTLDLPRYDKDGQLIKYRTRETKAEFKNGTEVDLSWNSDTAYTSSFETEPAGFTWNGTDKPIVSTLRNDYSYVSMSFGKDWFDENDRDGKRADIELTLYRDGEKYATVNTGNTASLNAAFCEVTRNGNSWTITWNMLPEYKVGDSKELSVYTMKETTGVSGYTPSTADDVDTDTHIDNSYIPERGSLKVNKEWLDENNSMNTRPDEVYLKLVYSKDNGSTWNDVEKAELDPDTGRYSDGTGVYTTSDDGWITITKAAGWPSITWEDLPLNAIVGSGTSATGGHAVTYSVVEGKKVNGEIVEISNNGSLNGYKVTYNNVKLTKDTVTETKTTNTLQYRNLTVNKNWVGDTKYAGIVRPESVTFVLKYKKSSDTVWTYIPADVHIDGVTVDADGKSTVTVSGETSKSSWSRTLQNLPYEDADGTTYEYQITEAYITYKSGNVAVNATDSIVGPYDVTNITVSDDYSDSKYIVTAENKINVGKLDVEKIWNDNDNRDDGEKEITVTLYRVNTKADGSEVKETIGTAKLNTGNGWKCEWTDLPVRNNNAGSTADYSYYFVRESGVDDSGNYTGNNGINYKVTNVDNVTLADDGKASVSITNTHDPLLINMIKATKIWNDTDKLDVRPASVEFSLQYRINGSNWTDFPEDNVLGEGADLKDDSIDPAQPYMASDDEVVQTVNASTDWEASWSNLTSYARVNGTTYKIEYRAVESKGAPNYSSTGTSESTDCSAASHDLSITNSIDLASLAVDKSFKSNSTVLSGDELVKLVKELKVLPETLELTLTASVTTAAGTTSKYADKGQLTFDERTKSYGYYEFKNLPVKDANGNFITYTVTDSASGKEFFDVTDAETTLENASEGKKTATIENTYESGKITAEKIWHDDDNRDDGQQEITIQLYRDGTAVGEKVKLNAENGWKFSWNDLPVYKDALDNGTKVKSVYSIREDGETDGDYTGKNGVDYKVVYTDVSFDSAGSEAVAKAENTHEVYNGSITVNKEWDDDSDKYGSQPETVEFTLYYKTDGMEDWAVVIKQSADHDVYTASDNPATVSTTGDGKNTYTWSGLPVNYAGKPISYKVTETPVAGYDSVVSPDSVTLVKGNTGAFEASVDAENTLKTTSITINKTWQEAEYFTPSYATFDLEYSHDGGNTWTKFNDDTYMDGQYVDGINVAYGSTTGVTLNDLPVTDGKGNTYIYRVSEKSFTYHNEEQQPVTVMASGSFDDSNNWSGTAGIYQSTVSVDKNGDTFVATANNDIVGGNLGIEKIWHDGTDRDASRDTLTFRLFRDGKIFGDDVEVTAEDGWTHGWHNLPVYKDDTHGDVMEKSVYTIKEVGEENGSYESNGKKYTVEYASVPLIEENNVVTTYITNTHDILKFDIKAAKVWSGDEVNKYGIRPTEIELKLVWSIDENAPLEDWKDVEEVDAVPDPSVDDGTTVFTTSDLVQKLTIENAIDDEKTTWGFTRWNDLPAYVLADGSSHKVYYRAVEVGELTPSYTSTASGAVCYTDSTSDAPVVTVVPPVTNELTGKTSLTVTKRFEGDVNDLFRLPDSIKVQLQYNDGNGWKNIPTEAGYAELSADGTVPWSYTWTGLRNDYTYRALERGISYDDQYISVEYATADETTGQVGGYDYTSSIDDNDLTQCIITNKLIVGSLEVGKIWHDAHNRDNIRFRELTFELYRDDGTAPVLVKSVNVTNEGNELPDGVEECIFTDLPVYADGSTEKSQYYVVEKQADTEDYVTEYTEVSADEPVILTRDETSEAVVTNTHEIYRFNITATKTWDDNDDYYGLRPASVDLKLQWAVDPAAEEEAWTDVEEVEAVPDPSVDDGTGVFTTSPLIQTLTVKDMIDGVNVWGTVMWNDLPGFVLMNGESTAVYYRVVEAYDVSESYGMIASEAMSISDAGDDYAQADLQTSGNVTNPLEEVTEIKVVKKWVDNNDKELSKNMPASVTVQLQYRADGDSHWEDVPRNSTVKLTKDNDWTYTFDQLRDDYEYRVVEVSISYKGKNYDVKDRFNKMTVGDFTVEMDTKTVEDPETGAVTYESTLTNTLKDRDHKRTVKTGDDMNAGTFAGMACISAMAGIACVMYMRRKKGQKDA